MRTQLAFALISLTVSAAIADADPITIGSTKRFVVAVTSISTPAGDLNSTDGEEDGDSLAGSVLSTFDHTQAQAKISLVSHISANLQHFSGLGMTSASAIGRGAVAGGNDLFSLFGLEIDQPHAYIFKANLELVGVGLWRGVLDDFSERRPFDVTVNERGVHHIERRGFIRPGRYDFQVAGQSEADTDPPFGPSPVGRLSYDFSFDLASTPEPNSLLLIGGAMLTLIVRSRRRISLAFNAWH
jgi:hypothetical protein